MAMARAEGRASPELSRPPDGQNAQLRGHWANLTDAILVGANLTDAILTRATLPHAYLPHGDLTRADLTGAELTGAKGFKLPPG
jgi:uncharacterized protein YjbI with pentapeptide repeats